MPSFQRFSMPLKLTLLLYLLALLGVGGYLFWPEPRPEPLRVTSVRLAPEGDRIVVEGEGFSAATQVSLALDVSNQRFLRHTVPTWGRGGDIVRVGQFAYATSRENGLLVLDLVEPERPQIVATLALPGQARNLVVEGGVGYIACDRAGLALVDISAPASPQLLTTLPELAMVQGLAIGEGRLYVSLFASGVAPALAVVDVANPRQPQLVGRLPLPGKPIGLALWNDQLLIAAREAGLLSLELGQGLPRLKSRLALPGEAHSVLVVGDHAYVTCTAEGLAVIALKPSGLELVARLPLAGIHTRLVGEGGRLYLPDTTGGGQVVDIEDPLQPRTIGAFPAPRGTAGIAVLGRRVYLNTNNRGLQVLDLSDPAPMQTAEQVVFAEFIFTVALEGDLAAVTTSSGQLHLFKGVGQGELERLATFPLAGGALSLQLAGGLAYIHMPEFGLEVIDLRKATAPVRLTSYPMGQDQIKRSELKRETSLVVAEGWGGFVDGPGKLWLFDIDADGAAPPRLGLELAGPAGGIALGGDLLYATTKDGSGIWPIAVGAEGDVKKVYPLYALPAQQILDLAFLGRVGVAACGVEGVYVVDFNDPAAPRLLAVLALPIPADHIRLQGTTAYVAATRGGLLQIDLSDPAKPLFGGGAGS